MKDMAGPLESQPGSQTADLAAGQAALERGAWAEARACYEQALARAESAEALEGLGMAAWWLNEPATYFPARERAYRLYRAHGDRRGAARAATWLALDAFLFRGEHAVCNGWFRRANRLLDGLDPGAEHAFLAVWEGYVTLVVDHDTARARRLGAEATALARSLGLLDLEMLGQALHGLALVSAGEVAAGMPLLDEATAAATAGEMTDLDAIVTTCCFLIAACEQVRDYDRAAQWCRQAMQIATRWSYRYIFSHCRAHYGGVLVRRGAWAEAEAELTAATDDLAVTHPAMAAEGLVRLAELRRRQGRLAEATALLDRLEARPLRMLGGPLALLERAALALDGGDAARAAELAERALRAIPPGNPLARVAGLEVLAPAWAAAGERDQAADALRQLEACVATMPTSPLRAAAESAAGVVAAAAGDHEAARRRFEAAVDLFDQCGAPYEAARARLELSGILMALGRPASAEQEAQAAHDVFARIGAVGATKAAADRLSRLRAALSREDGASSRRPALTTREREILRLVAHGLGDREIAATLTLSPHTVHRHMSNILTRLDAPTRAAAVAQAERAGLL
jgi:DNA-binding NarL/FixJ family response regulator